VVRVRWLSDGQRARFPRRRFSSSKKFQPQGDVERNPEECMTDGMD
jgi:hypothetical protein